MKGFAVGRTIFVEPAQTWFAGDDRRRGRGAGDGGASAGCAICGRMRRSERRDARRGGSRARRSPPASSPTRLAAKARSRSPRPRRRGATSSRAAAIRPVHALYYAGALIVIGAMGLVHQNRVQRARRLGAGGDRRRLRRRLHRARRALWRKPETRTPGGLAVAVAVSMAPLAVYGVQDALNLWSLADKPRRLQDFFPLMNASWVYMEVATIAAAASALRCFRCRSSSWSPRSRCGSCRWTSPAPHRPPPQAGLGSRFRIAP